MKRDFSKWLLGFRDSIATWKYYTDFEKVYQNVERIKGRSIRKMNKEEI